MTQRTFGHWLWLVSFGVMNITPAGTKAFHLHNNDNTNNNNNNKCNKTFVKCS